MRGGSAPVGTIMYLAARHDILDSSMSIKAVRSRCNEGSEAIKNGQYGIPAVSIARVMPQIDFLPMVVHFAIITHDHSLSMDRQTSPVPSTNLSLSNSESRCSIR